MFFVYRPDLLSTGFKNCEVLENALTKRMPLSTGQQIEQFCNLLKITTSFSEYNGVITRLISCHLQKIVFHQMVHKEIYQKIYFFVLSYINR